MDCCDVLCGILTCCCECSTLLQRRHGNLTGHTKHYARYVVCNSILTLCRLTDISNAVVNVQEPSICNCCSKKSDLDDPNPQNDPELVQDQPHHTHAMMVRGKFADDGQNAGITHYQGAKPKLR